MAPIISSHNPGGVDESTLSGTGRGGLLSDGYLRDGPLASHLLDDETPVFVRSNGSRGVAYEHVDRGDGDTVRPGDGYRAFAVATDSRLLFVVGDTADGDHAASVPLADIELVEASSGLLAGELVVTTTADVRWQFPCRDGLDEFASYLEAASMAWMRVERRLDAARSAVVEAAGHLEAQRYDAATDAIRDGMTETDAARRHERELSADGVDAVGHRIERIEDRTADVRVRTLEGRATHSLDIAESRWRDGEYDAAHDAFGDAHDDYAEALSVCDDAERASTLRDRLDRVERNVAALERAPIERAQTARERAAERDDLADRADDLAYALECYRTALALDWGRSAKRFAGDTDETRAEVDAVATELVEARRRLAAEYVRRGDDHAEAGQPRKARERYRDARDALEATLEPARELVPAAAADLRDHLDTVHTRLDGVDPSDDQTPVVG
jgi:hypothetical protein